MDISVAIVRYTWLILFAVWMVLMFTNKRTSERDRPASQIWYRASTLLSYLLMFTPWFWIGVLGRDWIARGHLEEDAGAVLTVIGVAIAIWARLSIGRNWSGVVTVKEEHQLVRVGPYAWVRHPIYTGLITAMIGTAFINRRWAGVIAVLLMAAGFVFKSRIEERYMVRTFGSDYKEYRAHSGAFLPRF